MRSKGKAIALLIFLCLVLAFTAVMSFITFPVGVNDYNGVLGAVEFDYDLEGGKTFTYKLASDSKEVEDVDEVVNTIKNRLSALGYKTFTVDKVKDASVENAAYNIRISAKDTASIETDMKTAMAYGTVKFFGGSSGSTTFDPTEEILKDKQAVADAYFLGSGTDENGTAYYLALSFTDYGYEELKKGIEAVGENEQYYLKVMLGDTVLMPAGAVTLDYFSNKTLSLRQDSEAAAKQMALQLKTGGLEYKYEMIRDRGETVTPMLGTNAKLCALIVAACLVVAVIVAAFVKFRGYGLIAMLAMLAFAIIELGMMVAVPGIVISIYGVIGMMVATLLAGFCILVTMAKIKEELELGRTFKAAVRAGYKRSFFTVIGACVTAAIVGLMTFIFAGGAVQSFGITLGIGAVVAFIASALVLRMFSEITLPLIKNPEKFIGATKGAE